MARSGLTLPTSNRQPNPRLPRRRLLSDRTARRLEAIGAPRKHRRPRHAVTLAREEPTTGKRWLIALILFSLLMHALIVVAIVFISRHTPKWEQPLPQEKAPEVNLVLAPPPPPPAGHKPEFIPTEPQQNAHPQPSPFISDNDTRLQSQNRTSRSPETPLPDVTGHKDHSLDLHSQAPSPEVKSKPSPPAPKEPQKPQKQKPSPKPNQQTKPAPPDPNVIHPTDNPDKGTHVIKLKPSDQQYDPNGLPVLPALAAPTLAPQTPQTELIPQTRQASPPRSVPSFAVYQSDVTGQAGAPGDNSPAARATDLGRYKAKVYRAVGALWYNKVNSQIQVLGVGTVHITYTIYKDGTLRIVADPDGGNPSLMLLHSLSVNSMTEAAPFDHFSDAMVREVGDSYTDDFSFSIYGN
jgi:hypothetical protein